MRDVEIKPQRCRDERASKFFDEHPARVRAPGHPAVT
jgi:hypothetical protein